MSSIHDSKILNNPFAGETENTWHAFEKQLMSAGKVVGKNKGFVDSYKYGRCIPVIDEGTAPELSDFFKDVVRNKTEELTVLVLSDDEAGRNELLSEVYNTSVKLNVLRKKDKLQPARFFTADLADDIHKKVFQTFLDSLEKNTIDIVWLYDISTKTRSFDLTRSYRFLEPVHKNIENAIVVDHAQNKIMRVDYVD